MDSNNNAASAAAATAPEGRGQLIHVIKATAECVHVASQFVLSCYGVREEPRRLRLRAFIALSYASVVALTLFARRLDARGRPLPLQHGRERWLKLTARALASLVLGLLILRTDSLMASILLFAFIW
jgi:hypothetical protein